MLQCRHCGAAVTVSEPIPREASCEKCLRDLHACVNCRHYDPSYHNSCRETEAEMVQDRERRNFCEFFSFTTAPVSAKPGTDRAASARAKLDALFRKPGADAS